jgi:tetrahydromethanopterin S-methyltransferase subunit E
MSAVLGIEFTLVACRKLGIKETVLVFKVIVFLCFWKVIMYLEVAPSA